MARMPGARWVPANDTNSRLPMQRWDIACIHTIVGHDPAVAAHFSVGSDGLITQSRDTTVQSAANLQGNPRVIAIENEDFGPEYGSWASPRVPRFTPAQAESNAQVLVWLNKTHGVPLVPCPNSRPTSRGIAYHRQGIDGNWAGFAYGGRVPGGEVWTKSPGKVCPGDARISQLNNEIIPRALVLAGLTPQAEPTTRSNPDMVITVATPNRCGLLSGGRLIDVTADATARQFAQNAINAKTLAEIRVSEETWLAMLAA